MLRREPGDDEGARECADHCDQPRIRVDIGGQRRHHQRPDEQDEPEAHIDPKECADLLSRNRRPLNHRHQQSAILRELKETGKGERDAEDAEGFRGQQARQRDGHDDIDEEEHELG